MTLSSPQTFPQSLFLISLVSFLLVRLNRLEAILTLTGQSPLTLLCSLGLSLRNFSPGERVKTVLREMPKKSCDLDPIPVPILHDCFEEITLIVVDIVNKSLSSGVVPSCFKHALVRPLLKKANLAPNCLRNCRPISNLPFLSKVLERIVLEQFFAALGISQSSGTLPVSLPKMS